uniref:Ubiquinone biosynthesis O-methyltransferase, mitochondrial n=1 Tax=Candidatus Methanogaster sp. ANME-2c ERB4 TaxID=2759911 RepID=A0A7G9Y412_9EURY|nr:ubiquinone biosynthesis O-methyltransferase, mitochondrial [Methanosarcinales archaeon ANME-2c ERB4]QNO42746.1 ubiquinone biosynthesis O-methyltransferase, mitochondrial [Methanosarcinales archaeon ANME-2c ERB4]
MDAIKNFKKNYILEDYDGESDYGLDSQITYDMLLRSIPSTGKILEIGCGMGHFSNYCHNSKRSVVSVDIGKSKMKMKNRYPFLSFVQADAEELPLKNNSFDVVLSIDLIEHLFDQNSHFKEVNRILKDGGLYIIKTPNKIYDLLVNIPYFMIVGKVEYSKLTETHPSTRTLFGPKKLLGKYNLHVDFYSFGRLSQIQRAKLGKIYKCVEKLVFNYFPLWLQPSFLCIAKK